MLDLFIIIVLILYFFTGLRQGFFVSLGTLGGFILGAIGAFFATPWVVSQVSAGWYIIAALITVIICLLVGQWLGFMIGSLFRKVSDVTPLRGLERLFGGLLNLAVCLLVIMCIALVVRPLANPTIATAMTDSKIVSWLTKNTPTALESGVNDIRSQIMSSGPIPTVNSLLFPETTAPTEQLSNPALEASSQSVVQVLGSAQACNYISEGSGFVVAPGYAVTNAHVLAGVSEPILQDRNGNSYPGQVVYLDGKEDLAIVRAPGMNLDALTVGNDVAAGTTVSFMGYPGGGPFQSRTGTVQGLGYTQTVNAATGETNPSRLVYQLAADVQQGNSGGPMLNEDGEVVGVIFAKATSGQTGYAIPATTLSSALAGLDSYTSAVATGACATS